MLRGNSIMRKHVGKMIMISQKEVSNVWNWCKENYQEFVVIPKLRKAMEGRPYSGKTSGLVKKREFRMELQI